MLLILVDRYGEVQASGHSPTHEEYLEARDSKPVLVFVQSGVDREDAQQSFVDEVQAWATGHFRAGFSDADELRREILRAVHEYELATTAAPVDEEVLRERALQLVSSRGRGSSEPSLVLAVAAGPLQQIVRPAELEEGARVWVAGPGGEVGFEGRAAEVADVFGRATSDLGGLDTVVGAFSRWWVGAPEEASDEDWAELAAANSGVPVAMTREAFRRVQGPESLIMLTNVWAMGTSPEMGVAGASKASLGPLIKAAAYRGAGRSLRVNGVATGVIDSPFYRGLVSERATASGFDSEGAFDRVVGRAALGRAATGNEVGKVVAFLASDHARAVTGVTVIADGGLLYA